ncbi:unnamed protein product, partial [Pleuronectes platessa]
HETLLARTSPVSRSIRGSMKEDETADRAERKEERSGNRAAGEGDKKPGRWAVGLVYSRANVVRDWEARNQLGKKGQEVNRET